MNGFAVMDGIVIMDGERLAIDQACPTSTKPLNSNTNPMG